jgi:hypothetical protein
MVRLWGYRFGNAARRLGACSGEDAGRVRRKQPRRRGTGETMSRPAHLHIRTSVSPCLRVSIRTYMVTPTRQHMNVHYDVHVLCMMYVQWRASQTVRHVTRDTGSPVGTWGLEVVARLDGWTDGWVEGWP